MTTSTQKRLLEEAVEEALRDPAFGRALRRAIDEALPRKQRRRTQPAIDPFATFGAGGEAALRHALGMLSTDQLKDVIAHHQMDRAKLAMKWQTPDRLIDLIVSQTAIRSRKGEAFLR